MHSEIRLQSPLELVQENQSEGRLVVEVSQSGLRRAHVAIGPWGDPLVRSADQTLRVIRTGKSTELLRGNQDSRSDAPHDQNFVGN
jgi:hypothetical protein